MGNRGRREQLKTVENLVTLMLNDPLLTRKGIMDRMTGKHMPEDGRPEDLSGISRQSVYKALDFLRYAGILKETSDQTVFRINRRTIKSITISIDMGKVTERYAHLWTENFKQSERFRNLPYEAKKVVLAMLVKRFSTMVTIDLEEREELLHVMDKNMGKSENNGIREYMVLQDIDTVMEYLMLLSKLNN